MSNVDPSTARRDGLVVTSLHPNDLSRPLDAKLTENPSRDNFDSYGTDWAEKLRATVLISLHNFRQNQFCSCTILQMSRQWPIL